MHGIYDCPVVLPRFADVVSIVVIIVVVRSCDVHPGVARFQLIYKHMCTGACPYLHMPLLYM